MSSAISHKSVQRNTNFDLIRVLAIFCVLLLHSDQLTSSPTNYVGGRGWWLAVCIDSFTRIGVPLFILLSGALMLPKASLSNYRQLLQKTVYRLLLPLLFWLTLHWWWQINLKGQSADAFTILVQTAKGNMFYLYFLVILIGLYVVSPFIAIVFSKLTEPNRRLLVMTGFIGASLYSAINYLLLKQFSISHILLLFIPYLCYFVAGAYVDNLDFISQKLQAVIVGSCLIVNSIVYYLTVSRYADGGNLFWTNDGGYFFWDAFSPLVIAISLIIFFKLKQLNLSHVPEWAKKTLTLLSSLSFGMYLVHWLVNDILDGYFGFAIHLAKTNLFLHYMSRFALCFLISGLISFAVSSLPILQWTVGNHSRYKKSSALN